MPRLKRSEAQAAPSRGRASPLALATFVVLAVFTASALVVSLFGDARDGAPSFVVLLAPGTPAQADEIDAEEAAPPDARRLTEETPNGPLPIVALDGTRSLDAYAAKAPPPSDATARIAILVTGVGLSRTATETAIDELPAAVSLAVSPYGRDLATLTTRARAAGHELFLDAPSEPYDYPENDPGPQAVLTSLTPEENLTRLRAVMGRLTEYAGLAFRGERFLTDRAVAEPIFAELTRRGLMGVAAMRNAAPAREAAISSRLVFAGADLVVDAKPNAFAIDDALKELEARAKADGMALGVASSTPVALARIAAWARTLGERGIELVPVTALQPRTSA